jgi:hypothetical protein
MTSSVSSRRSSTSRRRLRRRSSSSRDVEAEHDRPGLQSGEAREHALQSLGLGGGPRVAVHDESLPGRWGLQPFGDKLVDQIVWHQPAAGDQLADLAAERRSLGRHLPEHRARVEVHEVELLRHARSQRALARTGRADDDESVRVLGHRLTTVA